MYVVCNVLTFKVTQVLKVSMFNGSHSKYKWTLNFTKLTNNFCLCGGFVYRVGVSLLTYGDLFVIGAAMRKTLQCSDKSFKLKSTMLIT